MTAPTTAPAQPSESGSATKRPFRGPVGRVVERSIGSLQADYLADRSRAVAALAHLRRAVGKPITAVPQTWPFSIGPWSESDYSGGDASYAEQACHDALTLYAMHQQGRPTPMHQAGTGLGTAVRALGRHQKPADDTTPPSRRRFDAVLTATDPVEITRHLRGLVQQMRAQSIALDYAQLADDLFDLQRGQRPAQRVRLRWARELYRVDQQTETASADTTTPEEPE